MSGALENLGKKRRTIQAVGFDLMDTLIHDPWAEAVFRVTGIPHEQSRPFRDREAWADFELARIDESAYAQRFFLPESGLSIDLAALKREFSHRYAWVPGMDSLLEEVAQSLDVHILSNYPVWYEEVRARFALDRFVAGHHPSYLLGVRKPGADYFRLVLERIGIESDALLFVDDRGENVEAARRLGIPAIHFVGAQQLRKELLIYL